MQPTRSFIISKGRAHLIRVGAQIVGPAISANDSSPMLPTRDENDALKSRSSVSVSLSAVPQIFCARANAQIGPAVIQSVTVEVVNLKPRISPRDQSVNEHKAGTACVPSRISFAAQTAASNVPACYRKRRSQIGVDDHRARGDARNLNRCIARAVGSNNGSLDVCEPTLRGVRSANGANGGHARPEEKGLRTAEPPPVQLPRAVAESDRGEDTPLRAATRGK